MIHNWLVTLRRKLLDLIEGWDDSQCDTEEENDG